MTPCYADQKFNEALRVLALTHGTLRERLKGAYVWLSPILHQKDQIPPGLEDKWLALAEHAPLDAISEGQVKELAETIYEVARAVSGWSRGPDGWKPVWLYLEG